MSCVLLTGGTGFLGSHLLRELVSQGNDVVLLKRTFSNTKRIDDLLSEVKSYDIDTKELETVFQENAIDIVIHTATLYGRNDEESSVLLKGNVLFPLQLLDLCVRYDIQSFFNTDTFFNTDALSQYSYLSSYTLCKKQLIEWAKYYRNKLSFLNMKLEHVYGEDDEANKFIPWVITKLQRGEDIPLTEGNQKRDFIYVKDVVSAYTHLLSEKFDKGFYEFEVGLGKTTSVKKLVLKIKEIYELMYGEINTKLLLGAISTREGEVEEIKANISKLKKYGWKPEIELENGLMSTIRKMA